MPFERFGYLVLEQHEMVCQHVVKKSRNSHLVASDYMEHFLYAVVVLLADIYLLAEPCRDIGTAHEYCVIIQFSRLAVPSPAFRLLFGVRGGWSKRLLVSLLSEVEKVRFRPCFSLPAECLYRSVETS